MASLLRYAAAFAALLILAACSAPWSSSPKPSATATVSGVSPATREPSSASTSSIVPASTPTPTAVNTPSPIPSPTQTPTPSPTPTPTPIPVRQGTVASCCGVFAWADQHDLLVFDTPASGKQGAYLVNVQSGARTFLADVFGTPSRSGLIAFPNAQTGTTEIKGLDGQVVSTLNNGGSVTWISPDGKHVAWLVDQGVPNSSSLVQRVVKLVTASIDGSGQQSVLEFEDTALQWLPDNVHVMTIARAQDGSHPGIWNVDAQTGANGVVVAGTYIQALRLSPDWQRMAYLVTFSGDASKDGYWVANVDGSNATHLSQVGSYRWNADSHSLWFLQLAAPGQGNDQLVRVDVASDTVAETVPLDGRVLNDQWELSPAGDAIAFWNQSDQTVHVQSLTP